MKRLTYQRVARWLWEKDGEPECSGLGEVGLNHYRESADEVFAAIRTLGFKIVPIDNRTAERD